MSGFLLSSDDHVCDPPSLAGVVVPLVPSSARWRCAACGTVLKVRLAGYGLRVWVRDNWWRRLLDWPES